MILAACRGTLTLAKTFMHRASCFLKDAKKKGRNYHMGSVTTVVDNIKDFVVSCGPGGRDTREGNQGDCRTRRAITPSKFCSLLAMP